ncbi:MAG: carboxyltransferase domain-containing protein, partial [Rubrimonas sp.]
VAAGQTLALGAVVGPGARAYLAVRGGFEAAPVLGARATFTLGGFGGHATGALQTGDALRLADAPPAADPAPIPPGARPELTREWRLGVLYGPHGAPDFFAPEDVEDFFSTAYEVHFNSARTGVRLIGPKPRWARADGGEAGLHPSNIHDNAYAVGAVDFTGDMPIILGPDGPSLGGFVCPAVVALAEMWKTGQLAPGDRVRFEPWTTARAEAARRAQEAAVAGLSAPDVIIPAAPDDSRDAVLRRGESHGCAIAVRRAGDDNVLVEFGPPTLDLSLRFRAHSLMGRLRAEALDGVIDLTPGIRSLQIHHDPAVLPQSRLLDILARVEPELPPVDAIRVPSRIVRLPLSWDDAAARQAVEKYRATVNPSAPWCPSNIEFIRRINGLADEDEVRRIVFGADYMVLGLGDVYLGAPVATPVDPRHRLVTTKYNPARTWTPENAVGIGGAYMCVYGMEGPGGYQLVGRTVQMWNTWRATPAFARPHLLRFFDRIRFFPVTAAELAEAREAFPHGAYDLRIEEDIFDLADHRRFEASVAAETAAFQSRRQAAFEAERRAWAEAGLTLEDAAPEAAPAPDVAMPPGGFSADAAMHGSVWKLLAAPGQRVVAGETVAVLESMKMEVAVAAPAAGVVAQVLVEPGREVRAGQPLMVLSPAC